MTTFLVALITCSAGFIIGATWHRQVVIGRMKTIWPLLNNALTDLIHKAMQEGMTREDMRKFIDEEMNFMDIVLGEKGKSE